MEEFEVYPGFTPEEAFFQGYLEARGFYLEQTGGGCLAYIKILESGKELWLTTLNLNSIEAWEDSCILGLYQDEDAVCCGEAEWTKQGTVAFLLEHIIL